MFNRCWKLSKIHILCKFGEIPCNTFWLMVRTSPKCSNFECFKAKWPWRWRSRSPIINRLLKLGRIHMQTKFEVIPSNGFWLIVRTSMFTRVKCIIGPKLRKQSFFKFLNFKKPGTYVKHLYMNSICTNFEGHRWNNDSVIDHAIQPPQNS